MSDHSISIVPKQLTFMGDRHAKAKEIVQWLAEKQAIEPQLSDCVLGGMGYRLLSGMTQFLEEPEYFRPTLVTLGLEVIMENQVFCTIENGIDKVICPHCHSPQPDPDVVYDMAGQWWRDLQDTFPCPSCGRTISIVDWIMEPEWGFSDLGFEFWNCPSFNTEFINEIKNQLGCNVWIVYKHM